MLSLVVVDNTAESRQKIVDEISRFTSADIPDIELVPKISIKPLSPQELKFHEAPDVCIIGEDIVATDITEVAKIKKIFPASAIVVRVGRGLQSLATVEQLVRLGADEVLPEQTSPEDFLRRIIILSRRLKSKKGGKLILVDSGKGGLGVTTVTAGLAETLTDAGKRALVIDLDFETQDLSRFLQARPFLNDNLQALLDGNRPVTEEFVAQCLTRVWEEGELQAMSPVPESEHTYGSSSNYSRTFISILEVLDEKFDAVFVDMGSVRGNLLKTLYRVADKVVFLVNNDPASLYACIDKLARVRSFMAPDSEVAIVANNPTKHGLSEKFLKDEFTQVAKVSEKSWSFAVIPPCQTGSRWPASGDTIARLGSKRVRTSMEECLYALNLLERPETRKEVLPGRVSELFSRLRTKATLSNNRKHLATLPEYVGSKVIQNGSNEHAQKISLISAPILNGEIGLHHNLTNNGASNGNGHFADHDLAEVSALVSGAKLV